MEIKPGKKIAKFAANQVKKKFMNSDNGKPSESRHADTIIRNHVVWSMGAGLVPIIVLDIVAVSATQIDMIRQLSKAYGKEFNETQGKAIVSALASSTFARMGARSLAKMIPVVGSIIGGVTASIFAGASTFALGQVFKKHFESGGTILDLDVDRFKSMYKEQFEKGKEIVDKWKGEVIDKNDPGRAPKEEIKQEIVEEEPAEKTEKDLIVDKLHELKELRKNELISEKEYADLKDNLLKKLSELL
jgi:uncharacterized protein (DUF697 family)